METQDYSSTVMKKANIRIIAIGGGGSNVLNKMLAKDWKDVNCIAANTDMQSLERSDANIKILLGKEIMGGMGAGSNPVIGRKAALESRYEIRAILKGAEMVIILTCLGGGTGTGGAPVVAEISKELGATVIAVVSTPFTFEGTRRREESELGLATLKEKVDSIIVIHSQRILIPLGTNATLLKAFEEIDWLMSLAVGCVAGVFYPFGLVSANVGTIKTMLLASDIAGLGFGSAAGENRAITALKNAMTSPHLAGHTIGSSCVILVGISGPTDLRLSEVYEVIHTIRDLACVNSHIACTAVVDEKLGDTVWVTIVIFENLAFLRSL